MKLSQCDQKMDAISLRPIVKDRPDENWVRAMKGGLIPSSLYQFYVSCSYFSFGSAPRMLKDDAHLLFTLLADLCDGMACNFEEAAKSVVAITEASKKGYNPIKRLRGEKYDYDPQSHEKQSRAFKELTLSLTGILDQFSEVLAIVFDGKIVGTNAGRTQFIQVYKDFLCRPAQVQPGGIVAPWDHFTDALHNRISSIAVGTGEEEEWLEVLYLYRNKLAHLGVGMFMDICFADPQADRFYAFMPKKWPYHIEEKLRAATDPESRQAKTVMEVWGEILSHCDVVDFARGALGKVSLLIQEGMDVVNQTYAQMGNSAYNQRAFESVTRNAKACKFKSFK